MEIKHFDISYLSETKSILKEIFCREDSNASFNEWEFAENVIKSDGFIPELCFIALEKGKVIGYNVLTIATIEGTKGLALGPLGVKPEYQNQGIGTSLVNESIQKAKNTQYPWIVLLGGDYYSRFGFEQGQKFNITVSDNDFDNGHIQILFLNDKKDETFGKLTYCDAFYDEQRNLL